jgi:hypothetical protein
VLGGTLQRGTTVLAIVPRWDEEPLHVRLRSIRSAFDTTRLVVHTTALPPLGATAFSHLAAELAFRELVPIGVLLSSLDELSRYVVAGAWLGSVTRLRTPAPGMANHLRSYLPRAAFGAVVDDDPRVVRLKHKGGPLLPLRGPRVRGAWQALIAASETGDATIVARSSRGRAPGSERTTVPLTDISTRWWGTPKLVEIGLVPADTAAVAEALVAGRDAEDCRWCGETVLPPSCPFCGDEGPDRTLASAADATTGGPA